MNYRSSSLILALAVSQAFACGDDDSPSDNGQKDSAVPVVDGKVDGGVASDAGQAVDAARADSGIRSLDAAVVDSGPGKADTGVVDSGAPATDAGSDAGNSTFTAECMACEQTYCAFADIMYTEMLYDLTKQCDKLAGNATGGPKMGMPRKQLCNDMVACGHRTGCAKGGATQCICGAGIEQEECNKLGSQGISSLKGACRAEYVAAAETTDWGALSGFIASNQEISETATSAQIASALLECDRLYCIDSCFGKVCAGAADGTQCNADPAAQDMRVCMGGKCPIEAVYPAGRDAGTPVP